MPRDVPPPGRQNDAFRRAVRCCNSVEQKVRRFLANFASSDRDGS